MARTGQRITWICILTLSMISGLGGSKMEVTDEMVGQWVGSAKIIMTWCDQKVLHVSIELNEEGVVSGKIGDATVVNAKISKNRGFIGEKLNLSTDYIIKGELEGAIVISEGITRKGFNMPLNYQNKNFSGGIHTTGTQIGGKKRMILSATGLKLIKVE